MLLIKEGFSWFCISSYIFFLLPSIVLLQIIYFDKTSLNKHLPILLAIVIFPLYIPIFYGKIDSCGLFFILVCYMLVIFPELSKIDIFDNLFINLFAFLSIFLRRWYLYSFVCFYFVYLLKILLFKNKKIKHFINYGLSFAILAIVVLMFFNVFLQNIFNNNFAEAYDFYNRGNKILSFIFYLSPIIILISLIGMYRQFKTNFYFFLTNIISVLIPCVMVWRIQNFEYHHYYIFLVNIIFLFISDYLILLYIILLFY